MPIHIHGLDSEMITAKPPRTPKSVLGSFGDLGVLALLAVLLSSNTEIGTTKPFAASRVNN
jgi:hypothetical protein